MSFLGDQARKVAASRDNVYWDSLSWMSNGRTDWATCFAEFYQTQVVENRILDGKLIFRMVILLST